MNKTLLITAIALVAVSLAVSPIAIATNVGEDQPLLFSWNANDSSSDPNNLIIVTGSFTRMGLLSDTTTDVGGEFLGLLKGESENNSEKSVVTTAGPATISTTVKSSTHDANDLEGEMQIDGETFSTKLSLTASKTTVLEVIETFSEPTFSRSLNQAKLTIPVNVVMCDADGNCLEGFGVIRQEVSITSSGGNTITFATDSLEAEVIGEDGLFKLNLSKLQRTVETTP